MYSIAHMQLTEAQKEQLRTWVEENRKLSDIQRSIEELWGQRVTYMDVRFLIDDCQLELKSQPKPEPTPDTPQSSLNATTELVGEVSISVDKVTRPGAYVSGSVSFSDGQQGSWQIDTMGRLAIIPKTEGYHPSKEDIHDFQMKLQSTLHGAGY